MEMVKLPCLLQPLGVVWTWLISWFTTGPAQSSQGIRLFNNLVFSQTISIPEQRTRQGSTAIREAIRNNNTDLLDRLLKDDADVDMTDCFGVTPLFISVMCGRLDCAKLLLSRGASPNKTAIQNQTGPLHEAAKGGYKDLCELLLENKV